MPVNVLETREELPREGDVRLRGRGRRGAGGVEQGSGPVILLRVWPGVVGVILGVWLLRIWTVWLVGMMIMFSRRRIVVLVIALIVIMLRMRPMKDVTMKVGRRPGLCSWIRHSHQNLFNNWIQVNLIIFDHNCTGLSVNGLFVHNDRGDIFIVIILKLFIQ